jgi:hypothetical protein
VGVLGETGAVDLREPLGLPLVFGGVRVAHIFSFLCCDFCFVCPRPVSCVSNDDSFSGLYILYCPSIFSNFYLGPNISVDTF